MLKLHGFSMFFAILGCTARPSFMQDRFAQFEPKISKPFERLSSITAKSKHLSRACGKEAGWSWVFNSAHFPRKYMHKITTELRYDPYLNVLDASLSTECPKVPCSSCSSRFSFDFCWSVTTRDYQ